MSSYKHNSNISSPYSSSSSSSQGSSYAPSAPSLPESYADHQDHAYTGRSRQSNYMPPPHQPPYMTGYGQGGGGASSSSSYGYSVFPPGTHPDVVRSFQMVDRDRSGFIDENELQQALSSGYQRFNIRTIRLLMFLFKNPHNSILIGPQEFASLWSCLGQWRATFERYDRDRSGKINLFELRDALYGLGFAIPSSVLQVLISKYDDGSGRSTELNFDSFVECGMIVKGLTEKFKEKDSRYIGLATFNYDEFMAMVIPFLVSYD